MVIAAQELYKVLTHHSEALLPALHVPAQPVSYNMTMTA
jgi:hypothetical protein